MPGTTIHHVAKLANVSIKTVSRVLNDHPNVSPATRERVTAAVKELKFSPNISARSLAGSRSYLLGMILDNPSTDYVAKLQHGAIQKCRPLGFHIMVEWLDSKADAFTEQVSLILDHVRVDGFILSPPTCDNEVLLAALDRAKIPYVRITPYMDLERSSYVHIDNAGAAFEMTQLLLEQGHRDIAFIRGHPAQGATHLRYGGYCAALRSRHVTLRQDRVAQGDFSPYSGVACAQALLDRSDRPTAIFASNDDMALGVMLVANRLGLRVPQDLSVCGFDDTAAATLVWPQLTTVRQPIAEMSAFAAGVLIAGSSKRVGKLLEFEIVVRGSTAPPSSRS